MARSSTTFSITHITTSIAPSKRYLPPPFLATLTHYTQVTYDYPFTAAFRKPITIFLGVLSVFVTAWVIGRVDTSIGK
jgi:hypothetical protein